jgi:hypothetical protein
MQWQASKLTTGVRYGNALRHGPGATKTLLYRSPVGDGLVDATTAIV